MAKYAIFPDNERTVLEAHLDIEMQIFKFLRNINEYIESMK